MGQTVKYALNNIAIAIAIAIAITITITITITIIIIIMIIIMTIVMMMMMMTIYYTLLQNKDVTICDIILFHLRVNHIITFYIPT